MKKLLCLIAAISGLLFAQNPAEWPIVNNTGYTGFSPTTALRPPFRIKWTVTLPGFVSGEAGNGPVAAGGRVVLQGVGNTLFCLDADSGTLRWRYSGPQPEWSSLLNRFYPCIASGKVYAVFAVRNNPAAAGIRCLDLATGDSLWKKHAGFVTLYCHKNSPQVSGGRVFLHSIRDVNQSTAAQANWDFKPQVQAWDAATGDSLWTYTMWDSVSNGRTDHPCYPGDYGENVPLCVKGDTVFASYGSNAPGGRTVALDLDGNELWVDSAHHVTWYAGIQYVEDKLLVINDNSLTALNPADGGLIYSQPFAVYTHIRTSAAMNGRLWSRGCCSAIPVAKDISTGAQLFSCRLIPGDAYTSGCAAPRAANGFVYSGFGGPAGSAERPKLYVWNEAGDPVWWFATPDRTAMNHACQDVAIAYDRLYWITNTSGQVFCFESDNRTVASLRAVCEPDTLEQLGSGQIKAVIAYTDGSRDTTTAGCLFTNLDTSLASLRVEGAITGRDTGIARVRVSRADIPAADTVSIPVRLPEGGPVDIVGFTEDGPYCDADITVWRALRLIIPSGVAGVVQAVAFRHTAAAGQIRYGVYTNAGSVPVTPGDSTDWQDVSPPGWQRIDLINRNMSVSGGDTVWIAVRANTAPAYLCYANSGTGTHLRSISNSTSSGLPMPWVSADTAYTDYCGYAVIQSSGQSRVESGAPAGKTPAGHGMQAAPNPFNHSIVIAAGDKGMRVEIFDIHGVRVATFRPDTGPVTWNAGAFPAGIYMVRMKKAGGKIYCRKITLVK